MAQPASTTDTDDVPLTTTRLSRPARLEPANQDRVADGRRQLSAIYGRDLDDTEIHNRHFADTWDDWFQKELAKAKAAMKRRGPKGGQEPER